MKIPCSLATSFSYVMSYDPCVPFLLGSVPGSDVNAFHRHGIDSSNMNLKIFESSCVVGYISCPIPPYSLTQ